MRAAHDLTDEQLAELARMSVRASSAPRRRAEAAGWPASTTWLRATISRVSDYPRRPRRSLTSPYGQDDERQPVRVAGRAGRPAVGAGVRQPPPAAPPPTAGPVPYGPARRPAATAFQPGWAPAYGAPYARLARPQGRDRLAGARHHRDRARWCLDAGPCCITPARAAALRAVRLGASAPTATAGASSRQSPGDAVRAHRRPGPPQSTWRWSSASRLVVGSLLRSSSRRSPGAGRTRQGDPTRGPVGGEVGRPA